ncbi:MAG: 5-(carboxyamino)imidazole ribonucleotide mutase [Dehalococcoidia bacterium]|nr:5-(carboxyamino)imidazole ribonucleotide mutase [Dehalococcoidia bacterium]
MPLVGVLVGSASDKETVQHTMDTLAQFGVEAELTVASAHRNPDAVRAYVEEAPARGVEVFIAAAGGAAALPGVVASLTTLPVIGVPLASSELRGEDALYSIVQMPPGIPVATVAIGSWGARNAAILATQILALKYGSLREALDAHRRRLRER